MGQSPYLPNLIACVSLTVHMINLITENAEIVNNRSKRLVNSVSSRLIDHTAVYGEYWYDALSNLQEHRPDRK
jgi:hypothetical protein